MGEKASGLAKFAVSLAGSPDFGNVRVSKVDLAPLMAERILDDLRQGDPEVVATERPIVDILVSIFRVI
jgi:hypothetical protein